MNPVPLRFRQVVNPWQTPKEIRLACRQVARMLKARGFTDVQAAELLLVERPLRSWTRPGAPSYPGPIPEVERCDPACPGWLHQEDSCGDGPAIEACDECGRFLAWDDRAFLGHDGAPRASYVSRDDLAVLAHRDECGCTHPEAAHG